MGNKFNLINNIILSNVVRLNSPYKVTFALTYKCNLKCKLCRIWQQPIHQELSIEEIEKIFMNLTNLSWLDLTGGEITLREDAVEVVKAIIKNTKNLLIFHISTNGQLPDRVIPIAKEILESGLALVVNIGLDGPRVVNDSLKGLEGAYQRSLETFRRLKSLVKRHVYLSCTISDFNLKYLDEFINDLKRDMPGFSPPQDLHFNVFNNSVHYYRNQGINGSSQLQLGHIKKYLRMNGKVNLLKKFLTHRYTKGLAEFLNGDKFPLTCQALKSTCFVDPYGMVYPCAMYNQPVSCLKDYDYNINNLWNNKATLAIRQGIEVKACPGCWSPCEAYPAILGGVGQ